MALRNKAGRSFLAAAAADGGSYNPHRAQSDVTFAFSARVAFAVSVAKRVLAFAIFVMLKRRAVTVRTEVMMMRCGFKVSDAAVNDEAGNFLVLRSGKPLGAGAVAGQAFGFEVELFALGIEAEFVNFVVMKFAVDDFAVEGDDVRW